MYEQKFIPNEIIQEILSKVNLIDYFLYLSNTGVLVFKGKQGKEFIFTNISKTQKISVSEKGWKEFKGGDGGQIIKAVQKFQNLNWLDSIYFLKNFNSENIIKEETQIIKNTPEKNLKNENNYHIIKTIIPKSEKLIEYFKKRGISYETIKEFTKEIHFKNQSKYYFGIGIKNNDNGYEIRNPLMKTKIGNSSFSIFHSETAQKTIIIEGMVDLLSIIEIIKKKGKKTSNYRYICLNSVSNLQKLIENYPKIKNETIYLILDNDKAGDNATNIFLKKFPNAKDIRSFFKITKNEYKDLNEYLQAQK